MVNRDVGLVYKQEAWTRDECAKTKLCKLLIDLFQYMILCKPVVRTSLQDRKAFKQTVLSPNPELSFDLMSQVGSSYIWE
jgi:hypothetical protein